MPKIKLKPDTKTTITAYGMYCNSMCRCGLLSLTDDILRFEEKDFKSKNYHIEELEITIVKRKTITKRAIH